MTEPLSRIQQLRIDLDNLHYALRRYIGELAKLEQLGRTHTAEFKVAEENVRILKHNIARLEAELDAEGEREFEADTDDRYYSTCTFW